MVGEVVDDLEVVHPVSGVHREQVPAPGEVSANICSNKAEAERSNQGAFRGGLEIKSDGLREATRCPSFLFLVF